MVLGKKADFSFGAMTLSHLEYSSGKENYLSAVKIAYISHLTSLHYYAKGRHQTFSFFSFSTLLTRKRRLGTWLAIQLMGACSIAAFKNSIPGHIFGIYIT